MHIRPLPPEEWHKLEGHEAFGEYGAPDPSNTVVVVGEQDAEIIGIWCLSTVVHCEPVWAHPKFRSTTLIGRMWAEIRRQIDSFRLKGAFCFSDRPEIAGYLRRLGFKEMPFQTFLYEAKCPQLLQEQELPQEQDSSHPG